MESSLCYPDQSDFDYYFSIVLLVGVVVSTMPSIIKMVQRNSSLGFSPYYFLIGICGYMSTTANVTFLQFHYFLCCQDQSSNVCFANLLGFLVVTTQTAMYFLVFVFFLLYYPSDYKYKACGSSKKKKLEWSHSMISFYFILFYFSALMISAIILLHYYSYEDALVIMWAKVNGYISAVLALFLYVPQIYRTWKYKTIGAQSIPTMFIQTPGSFIVAFGLYSRPDMHFTTWVPYFIGAGLSAINLLLCIYFNYKEYRKKKKVSMIPIEDTYPSSPQHNNAIERSNVIESNSVVIKQAHSDII